MFFTAWAETASYDVYDDVYFNCSVCKKTYVIRKQTKYKDVEKVL